MNDLPRHKHIPFGPYLSEMEVDPNFCTRLLEVGKTLTKRFNQHLAGNIYHEYLYDLKKHLWIEEEFKVLINNYIDGYKLFSGNLKFQPTYKLSHLWINFQKSGEYNPIHAHLGCNLSFILFLEIPKEILEEKLTANGIPPGHTGFYYGETTSGCISHQVIRPKAGLLLMFPSTLRHYVQHFNSKVTRISVSGNIGFDEKKREGKSLIKTQQGTNYVFEKKTWR